MKNNIVLGLAAGLILITGDLAQAQQNLFNVPSGKITKPGEIFFQEQLNFTRRVGTSNSTFDIGVGRGWEVGFNVLDLAIYDRTRSVLSDEPQQTNPDLLFNVQKGFEFTEFWNLGVGTQSGFNPARQRRDIRFQNFSWLVNSFELPSRPEFGTWYVGGYLTNVAYAGNGNRVGFMAGSEIPIIKDKLSFQWDWISGTNDISVFVIGGVYVFRNGWQLSMGMQLPSPNSGNPKGLVLEFTIPGLPIRR